MASDEVPVSLSEWLERLSSLAASARREERGGNLGKKKRRRRKKKDSVDTQLPAALWALVLRSLRGEEMARAAATARAVAEAVCRVSHLCAKSGPWLFGKGGGGSRFRALEVVRLECATRGDLGALVAGVGAGAAKLWRSLTLGVYRAAFSEVASATHLEKIAEAFREGAFPRLEVLHIGSLDDLTRSLFPWEYAPAPTRRVLADILSAAPPSVAFRAALLWGMHAHAANMLDDPIDVRGSDVADPAICVWASSLRFGRRKAHLDILSRLLCDLNVDVNALSATGRKITALGHAVLCCDITSARALVAAGADPNAGVPPPLVLLTMTNPPAGGPGTSTLPWCHKVTHLFEHLITAGADPATTYNDRSVLHILLTEITIKLAARHPRTTPPPLRLPTPA